MIQIHVVSPGFQVTRRVVPRECFQKLSGCPFCRGVSGHREMHGTSAVMTENYEGEGELKCDGRYHEEVYGDQMLDVIVEKGSPRLGGRFAVPDHVLGDGCLRHLNSNPRSSPWMRGAPQRELARLIFRMRFRTSLDTEGRPSR